MLPKEKQQQLIDYWSNGSKEDLSVAHDITFRAARFPAALFFAHLAVQKSLKAAFASQFASHPPLTHNLLHLVAKLGWQVESEMELLLAEINDFNLEGRYPDEKRTFQAKATEAYAREKLQDVKRLLQWISSNSNIDF